MKRILLPCALLLAFIFAGTVTEAQTLVNVAWQDTTGNPQDTLTLQFTLKDGSSHILTVGNTYATSDSEQLLITKYTNTGTKSWQVKIASSDSKRLIATGVDISNGYIYIVSSPYDSATNSSTFVTYKLSDSTGSTVWSKQYTPSFGGYAVPAAVREDSLGNVFVSGTEQVNDTSYEMTILKYNSSGTLQFTSHYDSAGLYSGAVGMGAPVAKDSSIAITGYSGKAFGAWDIVTMKVNINSGSISSVSRVSNGSGGFISHPVALAEDGQHSVYVVGASEISGPNIDIKLIKYDSLFNQVWVKTWGGSDSLDDEPSYMVMDSLNNLIITGYTTHASGEVDLLVAKYDRNGNFLWSKTVTSTSGPAYIARGNSVMVDNSSNIYVTGKIYNGTDYDIITVAYDKNGNLLWQVTYDGNGNADIGQNISLDALNNVYVSGTTTGSASPTYITIMYKQVTAYIPADSVDSTGSFAFYINRRQLYSTDTLRSADSIFFFTNAGNPQIFAGDKRLSYVLAKSDSLSGTDTVYRVDLTLANMGATSYTQKNIFPDAHLNNYQNYYIGTLSQPVTRVQGYDRLVEKNVYKGIDWEVCSTLQGIKHYFVVAPGQDPSPIQIKYTGGTAISIANHYLTITTPSGYLRDTITAFTVDSVGNKTAVTVSYDSLGSKLFGISLGTYNSSRTLIVQSLLKSERSGNCQQNLCWSTYYGGTSIDVANDIKTDNLGNVFVTGFTESSNFPVGAGSSIPFSGTEDAFLTKFDASTQSIKWATFYGSTTQTTSLSVAPTTGDNVYICGSTSGTGLPTKSPLTGGTTAANGYLAAFSNSSGLQTFGTYYGTSTPGFNNEVFNSAAYDVTNNEVAFVGNTTSTSWPTQTSGHSGELLHPGGEGTLLKINNANFSLLWATTIGDGASTLLAKCVYDNSNELYVVGTTSQFTTFTLPTTGSSYTQTYGDGGTPTTNGLVMRFNSNDNFQFGTYIGEGYNCQIKGACVDPSQNLYICGGTGGLYKYKYLAGAYNQSTYQGGFSDGVISKFASDGSLTWSTNYGGAGNEHLSGVTTDGFGNLYVIGEADENNISPSVAPAPVTLSGAYSSVFNGFINAYLAVFNGSGTQIWSTYFGGNLLTRPTAIAQSNNTFLYVTGSTTSLQGQANNFPLANLSGAFNQGFLDNDISNTLTASDAFVSRFNLSVINPVGIRDIQSLSSLHIFPNPTGSELNVEVPADFTNSVVTIQIFNTLGQLMLNTEIDNKTIATFNTSTFASGVYIVRMFTGDVGLSEKFVKQ